MSQLQAARQAVSTAREQGLPQAAGDAAETVSQTTEGFSLDPRDFLAARDQSESVGTRIDQKSVSLNEVGEVLGKSGGERSDEGDYTNVIVPMVLPSRRMFLALIPVLLLVAIGLVGLLATTVVEDAVVFFGPHYWVLVAVVAAFVWWRRSVVMVPEGCHALITKFGKVEQTVGPGRTTLFSPWKRVSYILNTTREYPYNAPIREAPTQSGVKASVDLFLQFRIEDPAEFVFVLGATGGFSDKLQNAISEVTRSLIYQQRAEDIYDLVGESTEELLQTLNEQFLPAVRLTSANITHAEPSSQEYRMDLASPEMVRMAKDAYTHEYELKLRKQQNEGDLNKELASLQENLSGIQAEIAGHQARMDTAFERETHRAKAIARQRFVEAESTANANAALLEAQALDIGAASAAEAPEILDYRFQRETLDKLEAVAEHLPQVVQLGGSGEHQEGELDYLAIARQLVGSGDATLFSEADMDAIRGRMEAIRARIDERESEIAELRQQNDAKDGVLEAGTPGDTAADPAAGPDAGAQGAGGQDVEAAMAAGSAEAETTANAETVEEIRRSVTDESIARRVQQLGDGETASSDNDGPSDDPDAPLEGGEAR